ncbi:MAG: Ig-like domain repeat protein, partial [Ruthenibacterium sp.]
GGNYTLKSKTATATANITAKALTADMIDDIANQTYTGTAIKPTLTVTDGTPSIIAATDYTVTYKDNTNVGTATATVTATTDGNYSGTASKTFTINKENSSLTLMPDKASYVYGDVIKMTANVQLAKSRAAANTVEFFLGKTSLGTAAVTPKDATNGTATFTVNTTDKKIPVGTAQIITAVYGGNNKLNEKT